ncbi:MAG: hypothetical protein DSM106950_21970 [Stigonema ocellatum SAG 48.90 = DSM 106950]|nr:hypothetical protein [Stigonema ocellatum SAG 48.90 = DSM 106950]
MSKIEYLTLDLFTYNLRDETSNKQDDWLKLREDELKQQGFSTKINDEDPQRLDFWKTISSAVDGCYSKANFDDTDCLRYSCSIDQEIELSDIAPTLTQIKDLAAGILSANGYLGQTWMISGWTVPDNSTIVEAIAHQAYKALIPQGHQYQQLGELLGAIVYEMWRGEGRWEGIEKNSHVIVIFYPDKPKFQNAAQYYNEWRYLFYQRKAEGSYAEGIREKRYLICPLPLGLKPLTLVMEKEGNMYF